MQELAALGSSRQMALPHAVRSSVRAPLRPHRGCANARPQRTRVMGIDIAATVSALQHQLEEELVLEGALHVSAVQAGSCMQRFGSALDSFEAPELSANTAGPAQRSLAWEADSHVEEEAVCLATPCDPGGEARSARQARVTGPAVRISATAANRCVLLVVVVFRSTYYNDIRVNDRLLMCMHSHHMHNALSTMCCP